MRLVHALVERGAAVRIDVAVDFLVGFEARIFRIDLFVFVRVAEKVVVFAVDVHVGRVPARSEIFPEAADGERNNAGGSSYWSIMHRLAFTDVRKQYGRARPVLADCSLAWSSGVIALLGPNGAGKSTLLRIAATTAVPTSGRVTFDETDIVARPNALRRCLGYVPQDTGVYPHLSAREFLEYVAALKGITARDARRAVESVLDRVNLGSVDGRPLAAYSGGMRQRVALAQALLGDPLVLIADEPTVGLDPEERARFRDVIAGLGSERIVVVSTHIVSDIATIADRVTILAHGRIVADAAPADLVRGHADLETAFRAITAAAAHVAP
jgi:ABC-type multidrug transport system ATPase subunit